MLRIASLFSQLTLVGLILVTGAVQAAEPNGFVATATPSQELSTPTVGSPQPSCIATFRFVTAGLHFVIRCINITGVTAAHIHTGTADDSNPVRLGLYSSSTPTGAINGVLASGTISVATIGGVAAVDALKADMKNDNTYFNVHTTVNTGGEVRGQITSVLLSALPSLTL